MIMYLYKSHLTAVVFFLHSTLTPAKAITSEAIQLSDPQWIVPANNLPSDFHPLRSNNCVGIAMHEGRLYVAWRSAPSHFASKKTHIFIASSPDMGATWTSELNLAWGTDMREPFLISFHGKLIFSFFEGGHKLLKFEPKHMYHTYRISAGQWSQPETFGEPGEVPWELKVRQDKVYMTSYVGNHYSAGRSVIKAHFSVSDDGWTWRPANPNQPVIYKGGVSEIGFEFTDNGKLWAVTRNEDGDETGWGSQVATAEAWGTGNWTFPDKSDPSRFDSPRMFRHGEDLFLVARRDIGGPFDRFLRHLPFGIQKWVYLTTYSLRPKRTALYQIDQTNRKVVWIKDLPSAGDTSFASIVQTGVDDFLVANYTSPVEKTHWSWLKGQTSGKGTGIYLMNIHFPVTVSRRLASSEK